MIKRNISTEIVFRSVIYTKMYMPKYKLADNSLGSQRRVLRDKYTSREAEILKEFCKNQDCMLLEKKENIKHISWQ